MEENNEILNRLKKRAKPSVDKGFFESFLSRLMAIISNELPTQSDELSLKKTNKPKVPDGFFENFSENLMQKIEAEEEESESSILDQLVLRAKPEVPDGYFDSFEVETEAPKVKVIYLKYFGAVASVAAVVTLLFWFIGDPIDSASTDVPTAELEEEVYDELLAYSGDHDIIDYIVENDVEISLEDEQEADEEELFDFYGSDFDLLTDEDEDLDFEEEEDADIEDLFDFYGSDLDILTDEEEL